MQLVWTVRHEARIVPSTMHEKTRDILEHYALCTTGFGEVLECLALG